MNSCLTKREQEILTYIIGGYSNPQIAKLLIISESTAKAHVSHILCKLEAKNRVEAIVKALKYDLVKI